MTSSWTKLKLIANNAIPKRRYNEHSAIETSEFSFTPCAGTKSPNPVTNDLRKWKEETHQELFKLWCHKNIITIKRIFQNFRKIEVPIVVKVIKQKYAESKKLQFSHFENRYAPPNI